MRSQLALLAWVAAVMATPFPQGVTQAIAPPQPAPSGCLASFNGKFGIAVVNISHALVDEMNGIAPKKGAPALPAGNSGQKIQLDTPSGASKNEEAAGAKAPVPAGGDLLVVTQIADGQIQAPTAGSGQKAAAPSPAPAPAPSSAPKPVLPPAPSAPAPSPEPPIVAATPVGSPSLTLQITQTVSPVPVAPPPPPTSSEEPTTTIHLTSTVTKTVYQVTKSASPMDGMATMSMKRRAPASADTLAPMQKACKSKGTLEMTLNNGILKDARGWTGYIASNQQFQFDDPPQSGSIYTAGWSLCSNGSLALGGSAVFYQCRSGDFYNLYDQNIAPQCNPITIKAIELNNC